MSIWWETRETPKIILVIVISMSGPIVMRIYVGSVLQMTKSSNSNLVEDTFNLPDFRISALQESNVILEAVYTCLYFETIVAIRFQAKSHVM